MYVFFAVVDVSPDVNSYDVIMGKDKKKKGKGKEKTADKTEKKLKSKVLKKTGEVRAEEMNNLLILAISDNSTRRRTSSDSWPR